MAEGVVHRSELVVDISGHHRVLLSRRSRTALTRLRCVSGQGLETPVLPYVSHGLSDIAIWVTGRHLVGDTQAAFGGGLGEVFVLTTDVLVQRCVGLLHLWGDVHGGAALLLLHDPTDGVQ